MACLISTRLLSQRLREKTNNKLSKNKSFKAKTKYLKLKASSNNVKMKSDKTLTTQINLFLTIQKMKILHNGTR